MKYLSIIIFLGTLLNSCTQSETIQAPGEVASDAITLTSEQVKANNIKIGQLPKGLVYHKIKATGRMDVPPNNSLDVSVPITAYVKSINVLPGDVVTKGQILAVLNHPSIIKIQSSYLAAKSELDYMLVDLIRKEKLTSSSTVSAREYEALKAQKAAAESTLSAIEADLDRMGIDSRSITPDNITNRLIITAPISGTVTEVFAKVGALVNPDVSIININNRDHQHVELQVYQTDIPKLELGMDVEIKLPKGDDTFKGEVFLINGTLNSETLATNVHVHPEEHFPKLARHSVVFAEVIYGVDSGYVMSSSELIRQGDRYFVFVKDGDGFSKEVVEVGHDDGDNALILGPQNLLDRQFVISGSYYLNGI
ncbi:MAG: efflux RND transporter periplasmic adaptor subunit [Cyclobacteriaceae bacterium]